MTAALRIILYGVISCSAITVHSFQYYQQQPSRFAAEQIRRRLGEQYSNKEEQTSWRLKAAARPPPWDDDEEDDSFFFRDDNRRGGGGPGYRSDPRERLQPPLTTGPPRGQMDFPTRRRRKEEETLARKSSYDEDPTYEFDSNEDDMFEEDEGGGNYWSNPPGRYDRSPQQQQARRGARRMPRPNDPPRARQRRPSPQSGEKMRRNYNGRPRKTTFRSGTPPPPPVVGDFYKQLFWYGFDPDDSSSPADKTMFGGTKGKFNGLSYLYDEDPNELERRRRSRGNNDDKSPRPRRPPAPRRMRDEYDDYDDYEDEDGYGRNNGNTKMMGGPRFDERDDDYDMPACYYDDQSTSKHYFVTPPNDAPFIRVEENLRPEFRQTTPPPQSPPRQQRQRRRDKQNLWQGGDIMGSEDGYAYNGRSSRDSVRGNGGGGGGGGGPGGDWAAKKVASWFRDWEEGDDYIGLRDDQYEEEPPPSGRRGRQRGRGPVDGASPWSPNVNVDIFTSFFGRPSRDMERQAEMYDRQMGIGANAGRRGGGADADYGRNGSRRPPQSPSSSPPPPPPRQERRKGYAYRYDKDEEDEDDGAIVDADVVVSDVSDVDDTTSEEVEDQVNEADQNVGNKQSVQPNGSVEKPKQQQNQGQEEDMQSRQSSWEQRQLVRERIPPPGVQAWGPNGDLGMDARMKAYTDAMQDVRDAEYDLEQKKNLKEDAIEAIEILRVDIGMATRRLTKNPREKANLRDLELKLDQAQYRFRRTRDQEKFAQERLSELKDWYGPLLGLYNPTQAEQTVDNALQDFQQEEPAARDQTD